ncbi:MAG: alcohol dehydrogenase [Kangiellaceae bacterium]|nr:alcohol dehydrogenase [Kangiellaceae bacterium]
MKSQQFEQYGEALVSHQYEIPVPKGEEVLIKISACGVCHSDVHVWEGHFDLGEGKKVDLKGNHQLPFTLGHEIAGEVIALGETANKAIVGNNYVVYPWIGCGQCPLCEKGEEHLCNRPRAIGVTVDGGFSEYVIVPSGRYLYELGKLPASLACTYACSGVTAYSAVNKVKSLVRGRELLIVGAGGVGLSALSMAKALLNCKVIVADIDQTKRELALQEGADIVIDPNDRDEVYKLRKSLKGGVAAAVDFVGSDRSLGFGMKMLNKGGTILVVGLFGGSLPLSVPMLPLKAITISGSFVGSTQDMKEMMELVHAGKINPIKITQRPLSQAHQTLKDLQQGKVVGRVVLTPGENS